jgi:hypothetical protein
MPRKKAKPAAKRPVEPKPPVVLPVQVIKGVNRLEWQDVDAGVYAVPNQGHMVTFVSVQNAGETAVSFRALGLDEKQNIETSVEPGQTIQAGPFAPIHYNLPPNQVVIVEVDGAARIAVSRLGM